MLKTSGSLFTNQYRTGGRLDDVLELDFFGILVSAIVVPGQALFSVEPCLAGYPGSISCSTKAIANQ